MIRPIPSSPLPFLPPSNFRLSLLHVCPLSPGPFTRDSPTPSVLRPPLSCPEPSRAPPLPLKSLCSSVLTSQRSSSLACSSLPYPASFPAERTPLARNNPIHRAERTPLPRYSRNNLIPRRSSAFASPDPGEGHCLYPNTPPGSGPLSLAQGVPAGAVFCSPWSLVSWQPKRTICLPRQASCLSSHACPAVHPLLSFASWLPDRTICLLCQASCLPCCTPCHTCTVLAR